MDGWMNGWMNGWMRHTDGFAEFACVCDRECMVNRERVGVWASGLGSAWALRRKAHTAVMLHPHTMPPAAGLVRHEGPVWYER